MKKHPFMKGQTVRHKLTGRTFVITETGFNDFQRVCYFVKVDGWDDWDTAEEYAKIDHKHLPEELFEI